MLLALEMEQSGGGGVQDRAGLQKDRDGRVGGAGGNGVEWAVWSGWWGVMADGSFSIVLMV